MPTVLKIKGFRFYFFSKEPEFKPPHVHVDFQGRGAIFFLGQ